MGATSTCGFCYMIYYVPGQGLEEGISSEYAAVCLGFRVCDFW